MPASFLGASQGQAAWFSSEDENRAEAPCPRWKEVLLASPG